jgi:hypothetical protein
MGPHPLRSLGLLTRLGTLLGLASLACGRYAMIDDGLGFRCPGNRCDRRVSRQFAGVAHATGIEWTFGRERGLGPRDCCHPDEISPFADLDRTSCRRQVTFVQAAR